VPMAQEVSAHGVAHVPEADEADLHFSEIVVWIPGDTVASSNHRAVTVFTVV
jgi:hypothetical protein